MTSYLPLLLRTAHLLGLALGVGAATVKLVLLFKCRLDRTLVPVYLRFAKLITGQIIVGMVLLTLSGIGWLMLGYPLTSLLVAKIVLVAAVWLLGPFIDNVVEPRLQRLALQPGEPASAALIEVQSRHFTLEVIATMLFYVIVVAWVQR